MKQNYLKALLTICFMWVALSTSAQWKQDTIIKYGDLYYGNSISFNRLGDILAVRGNGYVIVYKIADGTIEEVGDTIKLEPLLMNNVNPICLNDSGNVMAMTCSPILFDQ